MRIERIIATASVTFDEASNEYGFKLEQIVEDTSQDHNMRENLNDRLQVREMNTDKPIGDIVTITIEKSNAF